MALGRAVAQQQKLSTLHRTLAVAQMAAVDLPHQLAHLLQLIPQLLHQLPHGGGRLGRGAALHPGVIQRQGTEIDGLALVQPLLQSRAVVEQVVAGLEPVVGGGHHLLLVLAKQLQHLLRGTVAGQPVDVVADGGVEPPERAVQLGQVGGYLPQHVLIGGGFGADSPPAAARLYTACRCR